MYRPQTLAPGVHGLDVVQKAKSIDPGYPMIAMTGYPSSETATDLQSLGVTDYITKPFDVDLIIDTVARVIQARQSRLSD